ncbi:hypothetical protein [Streptomyces mirabilis]|uniref:hypothetical protein n=1 Tax=Streptomyces mirabilis TaxID=68239 RepID=UPI00340D8F80
MRELQHARIVHDALTFLILSLLLLAMIITTSIALYETSALDEKLKLTPKAVTDTAFIAAIILSSFAIAQRIFQFRRKCQNQTSDLEALRSCFYLLHLCGELTKGQAKPLEIEKGTTTLCEELGDFATSIVHFPDPNRRESVSKHVSQVQLELMRSSGILLSDGAGGVPNVVKTVGTLLDRIIEQRWLHLLDLPDTGNPESVTRSPQNQVDRRDVWIVIGGSVAAALGLGAAASMGVPLAAAVPAALIFLLGPATLWGSRRLGMSPRNLLDSVRTPVAGTNQAGSQQQTSPPGQEGGAV